MRQGPCGALFCAGTGGSDHPCLAICPFWGRYSLRLAPGGIVSHRICIEEFVVKKIIYILLGLALAAVVAIAALVSL
ncbi:MAG: hypothetical protein KBE12_18455, partial [Aeromonas sp.]|nr:hypothetical protein [Aeromonas sp.]